MLTLFTAPQVLPFSVAFAIVLGLGVLELLGLLISTSPSHLLDHLVPHHLSPHATAHDLAAGDAGVVTQVLAWLHVGRVPVLILLLLFLTAFAIGGFAFQWFVSASRGSYAPLWLASSAAVVEALAVVRLAGSFVARWVPGDETSAVSEQSFIGLEAHISAAASRADSASQATLLDAHGRKHFILVTLEGSATAAPLQDGDRALITAKVGALFVVRPVLRPILPPRVPP